MAQPLRYCKAVTENEIKNGRISITAEVRDLLFPYLPQETKIPVFMVDEKGNSYAVEFKVRKNRTKPEILAKGGKKFVQKRNLKPGDILVFSLGESPERFRVRVIKSRYSRYPSVPVPPPAAGLGGLSPPSSPPELTMPALGFNLIGSDHAPIQPAIGVELSLSSSGHALTKATQTPPVTAPPKGPKMAMAGSSIEGEEKLYGVKAEEQEEGRNLELTLGSPPAKGPMKLISPISSEKLPQVYFKQPKQKWLFMGPQVVDIPEALHLAAVEELQEPKPPTALVLAPPSARFNFSPPLILSQKPLPIVDPKTIVRGSIPFQILKGPGRILEEPARFEGGTSKGPETTNKVAKCKLFGVFIR